MRAFLVYLQLEWKKTIKSIPYFFAGAIVLALLAGTVAFSAGKLLYGEQAVQTIQVGVVLPGEDSLAKLAMRMIRSMDSVDSLCEFTYLDEEEGIRQLKSGEIFALMKLPEGLVEGIMNGTNLPVTVVFPSHSGLEASVFRELTEAGSSLLGTSQAGIYAADEYLLTYGMEVSIPKAEEDLNRIFLSYALSREVYFRKDMVSAAGDVGIPAYFAISAAVMVLLFLGIPAAPLLRPEPAALRQKLVLLGVGQGRQTAARLLSLWFLLAAVTAVPVFFCAIQGYLAVSLPELALWLFVCLAASGWILLFYELCRNTAAAILFLFTTTSVMLFLSGGIIPSVFLPEAVQSVGKWMPSAFLTDAIRFMVIGVDAVPAQELVMAVAKLSLTVIVSFALSAAAGRRE